MSIDKENIDKANFDNNRFTTISTDFTRPPPYFARTGTNIWGGQKRIALDPM